MARGKGPPHDHHRTQPIGILPARLSEQNRRRCISLQPHPIPEPLDPPSRHRLKCYVHIDRLPPQVSLRTHHLRQKPSHSRRRAASGAKEGAISCSSSPLPVSAPRRLAVESTWLSNLSLRSPLLLFVVRAIVAFACCCRLLGCPFFCLCGFIAEFQASSALPGCVRMVDLLVMLRCFVEVYWAGGRVLGRFKWGWQLESC